MPVTNWLAVLRERGEVWDIGQLSPRDKKLLNAEVAAGKAQKERAYWCGLGHRRARWFL